MLKNNRIEIIDKPGRGRGIFTKTLIHSGEIILISLPYASTINENWIGNVCNFCKKFNYLKKFKILCLISSEEDSSSLDDFCEDKKKKKGTKSTKSNFCYFRYCSLTCQKEDHIYHSKETCQIISTVEKEFNRVKILENKNLGLNSDISDSDCGSSVNSFKKQIENIKKFILNIRKFKDEDPLLLDEINKFFDDEEESFKLDSFSPCIETRNLIRLVINLLTRRITEDKNKNLIEIESQHIISGLDENLKQFESSLSNLNLCNNDNDSQSTKLLDFDDKKTFFDFHSGKGLVFIKEPTFNDTLLLQNNEINILKGRSCKNLDEIAEYYFDYLIMYKFIRSILKKLDNSSSNEKLLLGPNSELFRSIVFREVSNSFGIWEDGGDLQRDSVEMLGFQIVPFANFFNHDCSPNIQRRREGKCLIFYANKDILEGEECLISYVNINEPWNLRVKCLKREYFFLCSCQRCILDEKKFIPEV